MTEPEKLAMLKGLLKITGTASDAELTTYLTFAKMEILAWLYSGNTPEDVTDVPAQYEPTQVMACVSGYGISGAEGQTAHSENGIGRTFKYEDMVAYVRAHVFAYMVVL